MKKHHIRLAWYFPSEAWIRERCLASKYPLFTEASPFQNARWDRFVKTWLFVPPWESAALIFPRPLITFLSALNLFGQLCPWSHGKALIKSTAAGFFSISRLILSQTSMIQLVLVCLLSDYTLMQRWQHDDGEDDDDCIENDVKLLKSESRKRRSWQAQLLKREMAALTN